MVDLILLHGRPASGKLTVANHLNTMIGSRVFHNHLTIDVAKSLFDFGEPEFWDLVTELRLISYRSFFDHGSGSAVATWCYEEPEDLETFLEVKSIAASAKARVLPVFLNCDIPILESRVGNEHRVDMKKLTDVEQLRKIISKKNHCPVPDDQCLNLDSGLHSAKSNAQRIISNFGL